MTYKEWLESELENYLEMSDSEFAKGARLTIK